MLKVLSVFTIVATVCLMAWSIGRNQPMDALYQFFLGASVALLLRRSHEVRQGEKKAREAAESGDGPARGSADGV